LFVLRKLILEPWKVFGVTIKALSIPIRPLLRRVFYGKSANEMNFNAIERVHRDGQRYIIDLDDLHVQRRPSPRDQRAIGSRCRADGVADREGNTPARGERIYLTGRPIYA